jgi:hypothetical protein
MAQSPCQDHCRECDRSFDSLWDCAVVHQVDWLVVVEDLRAGSLEVNKEEQNEQNLN